MTFSPSVYLAVDLGAGSGRVIAGLRGEEGLSLEEVNRFENRPLVKGDSFYWDFEALWKGIMEGLKLAVEKYGADAIISIGVDTWGVDYGLVDQEGKLLAGPRHYRDMRTCGIMEEVETRISVDSIFEKTGVQFMEINTLPQLAAELKDLDSVLPQADKFLLMPDLINHRLTGQAFCERTNASTTQLYDPQKKDWSDPLFEAVGIPRSLAPKLIDAGDVLGPILGEIAAKTGLSPATRVIAVGSHDTASAVAGVPAEPGSNFAYLSSGTWALLGVEVDEPIISPLAREYNYTNEVGVFDTIRLLKNINGLWMVQECRRIWREQGEDWTYLDLAQMATGAKKLQSLIDPDDGRFYRRGNMPQMICDFCRETGQKVPDGPAEILRLVADSLALKIRFVLERLEEVIGRRIEVLHITGGGAQNDQLNQSISSCINRTVIVGPCEATAAGNIIMQMVGAGEIGSLADGRSLVRGSFERKYFEPAHPVEWEDAYQRFVKLMAR